MYQDSVPLSSLFSYDVEKSLKAAIAGNIKRIVKGLAPWGVGTAGVRAVLPEPAALGAAAQRKAKKDEKGGGREPTMHESSLAHRARPCEGPPALR